MPESEKIKLSNGQHMPVIGLGTGHPKGFESDPIVIDALELGYRHIDTAYVYNNQKELGEALKKGLQKHRIPREDVFVTTKVWNTYHEKDSAVRNCKTSLEMLQLDYVDLLLIHFPVGFKEGETQVPVDENGKIIYSDVDYLETWKGLEECLARGWAKSIGVSNFNVAQLKRLLANCTIKPVVNQVECHPYLTEDELVDVCKQNGIVLTAYAPLGVPKPKVMGSGMVKELSIHLLEDPVITEISERIDKSPAQVVLRWAVQRGTSCIPRSSQKKRLLENISIFDFELSPEDMQHITQLNKNLRAYPYDEFKGSKYFST